VVKSGACFGLDFVYYVSLTAQVGRDLKYDDKTNHQIVWTCPQPAVTSSEIQTTTSNIPQQCLRSSGHEQVRVLDWTLFFTSL